MVIEIVNSLSISIVRVAKISFNSSPWLELNDLSIVFLTRSSAFYKKKKGTGVVFATLSPRSANFRNLMRTIYCFRTGSL